MSSRLACVRGQESKDCGPAALATVARHYGVHVSLARVRDILRTDAQGTELTDLKSGAEVLGFVASAGSAKEGSLDQIPLPAIAHFNDSARGHFVTVHRVEHDRITVADPANGIVAMPRAEFMSRWSRSIVLLAPSPELRSNKGRRSPVAQIINVALSHRKLLVQSLVCAAAMAALGFSTSFFLQIVIDKVIPFGNWRLLHALGIGVLIAIGFHAFYGIVRQYLLAHVGYRVETEAGLQYVRRLFSLPLGFFERGCAGDVVTRLGDVDAVSSAITSTLLVIIVDLFLLAAATLFMVLYNARLALIVLSFIPVVAFVSLLMQRSLVTLQRQIRAGISLTYNQLMESATAIRAIKAFTAEDVAYGRFRATFENLKELVFRRNRLTSILSMASTTLTTIASVSLVWVGAASMASNGLSTGRLLFFFSLLGYVLGPVDRLAGAWPSLQQAAIGMERLSEIQDVQPENAGSSERIQIKNARGDIEFRNVSFAYRQGYPVVSDISFHVPAGRTLLILGETGSGKTSLANLLLGFYEPVAGAILIDGLDTRRLDKESLRHAISVVFQDPTLMSGTVRENIALGGPDASFDEIAEAARSAGAHDFITQLPKGYDYDVGDRGQALSSGQRQRIAIARALLRKPAILILDEATSNLDLGTERTIMETMRVTRHNLTTIVITHRLSNVRLADEILMLDKGRIVEGGSHARLIERRGKYFDLWCTLDPELHSGSLRTAVGS